MTLESTDQRLMAALFALSIDKSAGTHAVVAREYLRLGVRDTAHEHFSEAVRLDPSDASSHDALARIWRDWGTPHLGLGNAYRAVHHAPESAAAANTLATLLQAVGKLDAARSWYRKALALDGTAWYAQNNLCYIDILTREPRAVTTCRAAVALAKDAQSPRNNLALAYAAAGNLPAAQQWFRHAGDPASASYNYGIVMMASRDYPAALTAFRAALEADPTSSAAAARVRQAGQAVVAGGTATK